MADTIESLRADLDTLRTEFETFYNEAMPVVRQHQISPDMPTPTTSGAMAMHFPVEETLKNARRPPQASAAELEQMRQSLPANNLPTAAPPPFEPNRQQRS